MRLLIQNGRLIDGSGAPARAGGVLVEGERIAAVGEIPPGPDMQIWDAAGRAVCPAFVDIHRHLDAKPLMHGEMAAELRQGIATAVAGNCGFSLAPVSGPFAAVKRENDLPILGGYPDAWRMSFAQYMDELERSRPGVNVAALIGMGAIRICLSGFSSAPLTPDRLDGARGMIRDALSAGAAGVSAGIMYLPEFYTTRAEYAAMLAPLGRAGKPLAVHIRGEGDSMVDSVAEAIAIARDAQCPLQISHFKSCGARNWRREIYRAIDLIERARAQGQDVSVDFYPYTGGSTALTTMLPPAFVRGDMRGALDRLGTKSGVDELRALCALTYPDWDNFALTLGWERILISAVALPENRKFLGLSVTEAAGRFGFDGPVELAAHLMHTDGGRTCIINLSMDPQDVDEIARLPYSIVISDSIYADTDTPHPRLYGAFARLISDFVRERGVLCLEQAVRKMTSLPAARMNLRGRGALKAGNFADIVVFDPEKTGSDATYAQPARYAHGVALMLINGRVRVREDRLSGEPSGRAIRV